MLTTQGLLVGNVHTRANSKEILLAGEFIGRHSLGTFPLQSTGDRGDIFAAKLTPAGEVLWARHFGAETNEFVFSAILDGAGGALLAGWAPSTIAFDGYILPESQGSLYLARLSAEGKVAWATNLGGVSSGLVIPSDLAVDPSNRIWMAGASFSERIIGGLRFSGAFHACFSGQGDLLGVWPDGTNISYVRMALGNNGLPVIVYDWGRSESGQGAELRLAQLAPDGTKAWDLTGFAAGRKVVVMALRIDPTGNIYACGTFSGVATAGGRHFQSNNASDPAFLAKFSPAGDLLWMITPAPSASGNSINNIDLDGQGNLVALLRIAPEGDELLSVTTEGVAKSSTKLNSLDIASMAMIRPGNFFIAGWGALDNQGEPLDWSTVTTSLGLVLIGPPTLQWRVGNDRRLTLFWDKDYVAHQLERLDSLTDPQPTRLSGAITNGQFLEMSEVMSATRFYRLRKP